MPKYRESAIKIGAYRESPSGAVLPAARFPGDVTVIERRYGLEFKWPDEQDRPALLDGKDAVGPKHRPKTGVMLRREDQSGVSGTGVVADFAEFPSGRVVMEWRNDENDDLPFSDTGIDIRPTIQVAIGIHGHGGRTEFIYDNGKVAEQ